MSETKHTPGPWKVVKGFYAIVGGKPIERLVRGSVLSQIACATLGENIEIAERDANARLIAAAPELLEVLKDILAHVENTDLERMGTNQCTLCHTLRMKAHSAIAKAEGSECEPEPRS